MLFAPDAQILRRNAALGSDRCRLGEHQRRSTRGPSPEMREMPIVREAVDRGILAHWRDADAVREVNVAHTKFAEQMRHGRIVSIENDGGLTVGLAPAASIGSRDGGRQLTIPCDAVRSSQRSGRRRAERQCVRRLLITKPMGQPERQIGDERNDQEAHEEQAKIA
jgi:hypothetical protein